MATILQDALQISEELAKFVVERHFHLKGISLSKSISIPNHLRVISIERHLRHPSEIPMTNLIVNEIL